MPGKHKGFSLIEVLLTLILIGVLFSAFIYNFNPQNHLMTKSRHDVENFLMTVKYDALTHNTYREITITDDGKLILDQTETNDLLINLVNDINKDLTFIPNTNYIGFNPPGEWNSPFTLEYIVEEQTNSITIDMFGLINDKNESIQD